MIRRNSAVILCLLLASTAAFTGGQPRVPRGIYTNCEQQRTHIVVDHAPAAGTSSGRVPCAGNHGRRGVGCVGCKLLRHPSGFEYTDTPFVNEWMNSINLHSGIFNGITLCLTTTTDGLPAFPAAPPSELAFAPGFSPDCGGTNMGSEQQWSE